MSYVFCDGEKTTGRKANEEVGGERKNIENDDIYEKLNLEHRSNKTVQLILAQVYSYNKQRYCKEA